MAFYTSLLPRKKRFSSFPEFPGVLREPNDCYSTWAYWVRQIPGFEDTKSGWYAKPPSNDYINAWREYVMHYDKPEIFDGKYRELFGYNKAAPLFESRLQTYMKGLK